MAYLAASFIVMLLMCCFFAIRHGGGEARAAVIMMLTATLLTRLVTGLSHEQWPLAIIDGLLLVGLLHIALKSKAFWPLWTTAFHATTVTAHSAAAFSNHVDFKIMAGVTSIWSLFSLFAMPLGIMVDQRFGIVRR